jgi:NTP pyrophosphatase (non-canonical NTP hydrolase)
MGMHCNGLTKLIENCGQLIQVAAKKQAYFNEDMHPDGTSLKQRLEEEIGGVLAAIDFVTLMFDLDLRKIGERNLAKLNLYHEWNVDLEDED